MRRLLACLLPVVLLASLAEATSITADHLEYFAKEDKYIANGNVRIVREGVIVTSDQAVLFGKTGDAELVGRVVYEDATAIMNTEKANLNIDKQTGTMQNAIIFIKDRAYKDIVRKQSMLGLQSQRKGIHYWIYVENAEKLAEDRFHAGKATLTTCDSDPCLRPQELESKRYLGAPEKVMEASAPAWTVQGEDVDLKVGDRMTANKTTMNAKGVPFFYSPYFHVPMGDRATGFLPPRIGTSSFKGFMVTPSFYWAIDDNKDATIGIDYMSKLGVGKRLEYRYLDFDGRGAWSAYHLRDKENKRNYVEIKGASDIAITPDLKAYADINYVNHRDFYQRLGTSPNATMQRFLQSSAEISLMSGDSNRLYLSSQYWVDLNRDLPATEPQKLPEIGYAMHPTPVGPFVFDMATSFTNFVRQVNEGGQRFDIMPTLSHSFGDEVRFGQSLTLRSTLYGLKDAPDYASFLHRETFNYRAYVQSRFMKQYDSFMHIVEPSLAYVVRPGTKQPPLFDSTELFQRASEIQLAVMNRFAFKASQLALRLVQPYETSPLAGTRSLRATRVEGNYVAPTWSMTFDVAQDFAEGRTDAVNSQISFGIGERTKFSLGERYSRADNLMLYQVGFETNFFKQWFFGGSFWYNGKSGGLRDASASLTYADPCWAVSTTVIRRPATADLPADLNFMLLFELKGIGVLKFL